LILTQSLQIIFQISYIFKLFFSILRACLKIDPWINIITVCEGTNSGIWPLIMSVPPTFLGYIKLMKLFIAKFFRIEISLKKEILLYILELV